MILRHSAIYFIARGIPGLVNFVALALYTRLLAPEEFGRYALLTVGVGLVNVMVFQWLSLVAIRFLQSDTSQDTFLGGILAQFYLLAAITSISGFCLALVWPDPVWQRLLALAVPLLVTQAGVELSLVIISARIEPGRYGLMLGSKSVIATILGVLLAWVGLGATAPVLGLVAGQIVALLLFGRYIWRDVRPCWPKPDEHRRQLRYGLPLIVTFALAWVISGSDRLLLASLLDEEAVGYYSAGYDLAFQSLTLLLTIINTAAYPLAVKALEQGGAEQASKQLARNGEVIVAAALAGATGLLVLAPSILILFIGDAFRPGAAAILPIIVAASVLSGIKAYHFDFAFHLGEQSRTLIWVSGVAAVINIALNLVFIPKFGFVGAAWATLGAYGIALLVSAFVGQRAFSMPPILPILFKGIVMAVSTALGVGAPGIMGISGIWALPAGILCGVVTIFITMMVINLADIRYSLLSRYGVTTPDPRKRKV